MPDSARPPGKPLAARTSPQAARKRAVTFVDQPVASSPPRRRVLASAAVGRIRPGHICYLPATALDQATKFIQHHRDVYLAAGGIPDGRDVRAVGESLSSQEGIIAGNRVRDGV